MFVPKIPSMRIVDIAEALAPGCRAAKIIGIRPGREAARGPADRGRGASCDSVRRLLRHLSGVPVLAGEPYPLGGPVPDGTTYASDTNDRWLSTDEIREMAAHIDVE